MNRAISLVVCLLFPLVVHAQSTGRDSALGLPLPKDPQRPGAVVLHGGGRITTDVFDYFVARAGGTKAKIVFVPCAGYRTSDYSSEANYLAAISTRYSSWASLKRNGHIADFRFVYTDDPADANDARFVQALDQATGVWFSGGFQSRLNYRFVEFPTATRFQTALRGVLERGGVIGGTSAGMAAMPEIMTLYQAQEVANAPIQAVTAHGLGLFNRAIVEQHFDGWNGRLERFTGLLRDDGKLNRLAGRPQAGERMLGIGVEERTALVVNGSHLNVLGDSNVHLFLKTNNGKTVTWHELSPGERGELRWGQHGLSFNSEELVMSR
jgi:cyanophycinase